jgi:hypothetical protein
MINTTFLSDIHEVVERACDFCIHDHQFIPECEDLLRYLRKKKNENEGKIHDHFIGIIKYLHPEGSLSACVCYDPEEHNEDLRGHHYLYGPELIEMSQNG